MDIDLVHSQERGFSSEFSIASCLGLPPKQCHLPFRLFQSRRCCAFSDAFKRPFTVFKPSPSYSRMHDPAKQPNLHSRRRLLSHEPTTAFRAGRLKAETLLAIAKDVQIAD
ncbi:hypothetical protein XH94_03610 [Bradyrhizobium zhanjiangense]|uniref:Uncharacterized protein n=1 Tax=Bradyrhizobium zhanjiangense TaxID=1325107 RepID=A0A4Q0SVM7_9BRAD|nr:hypothetical protein XH94_03610 [Bradyrhizobium zhanjiangense]